MEAYLDNSATTRCSDRACQLMVDLLTKDYGNPSSLHMKGIEAERFVETAKKKIAKTLTGVSTGEKIGDAVIKRSKKGNITPE